MRDIVRAWRSVRLDAQALAARDDVPLARRPTLLRLGYGPFRVAFLMRLAASGGGIGRLARNRLLSRGDDVAPGAVFQGALILPHPVGIVIGRGVVVADGVTIYQNSTLGGDRAGGYPRLAAGCVVHANSVVYGAIELAEGTVVGAGVVLARDTGAGEVVRGLRA